MLSIELQNEPVEIEPPSHGVGRLLSDTPSITHSP